jgi:predicted nuclease of restriction endonuclease-like (RecB) superfamily
MHEKIVPGEYISFLSTVKARIQAARITAAQVVNKELISLYWSIGELIRKQQQTLGWGKSVVDQLSKDICAAYDGIHGFSPQNLWYMRQFYTEYQAFPILQQLVGEIPWGHNILIFNKIKDPSEREYYLRAAARNGWSRNVLLNQIKAGAYSRHRELPKTHNFRKALPAYLAEQAEETLKDGYMLDFLGITKPVQERNLENRMVERIRDVIIEFGHGFAFIGNQYKIHVRDKEYFIDLLFYHRRLKCLVAIELKVGEFKPEYAGKMNFYLNLLDDFVKEKDENPSIGIILCAEKDNFEVEYSLRNIHKPVGVSEYYLTKDLPEKMKRELPAPEIFKNKLLERQ